MARKKSYQDLINQAQRLYRMDREANGGHYNTARQQKVEEIVNRYARNLVRNRGKQSEVTTPMGNKYTRMTLERNKKYSRSAYMSGSNG